MNSNSIKVSPLDRGEPYRLLAGTYGSPLMLLDCLRAKSQYLALARALPGVDFFYAVKSLPQLSLLKYLYSLGAGFDLASSGEIELARQTQVSPRRTIHTHPIKRDADIVDALRFGCTTFVVDNTDELIKFLPYKHRVGLLLRLGFRSSAATVDLSKKFGCTPGEASDIIALGAKLGIHIKGLSFHVGSQCVEAMAHVRAVDACNLLIRQHHDTGAAPLSILDIGGGFPVSYNNGHTNIEKYCAPIVKALAELPPYVRVIAEPGRFISGPAMTCVTTIIGKAVRDDRRWYYLDDGVYGSFSGQIFDHARYPLQVFARSRQRYASVLAGPTCDSIDVIAEDIQLPELQIGDIVVGHMMGAYTTASATDFNSLKKANIVVVNDNPGFMPMMSPDDIMNDEPFVK